MKMPRELTINPKSWSSIICTRHKQHCSINKKKDKQTPFDRCWEKKNKQNRWSQWISNPGSLDSESNEWDHIGEEFETQSISTTQKKKLAVHSTESDSKDHQHINTHIQTQTEQITNQTQVLESDLWRKGRVDIKKLSKIYRFVRTESMGKDQISRDQSRSELYRTK